MARRRASRRVGRRGERAGGCVRMGGMLGCGGVVVEGLRRVDIFRGLERMCGLRSGGEVEGHMQVCCGGGEW